jgi:tetratricopeptide (TPR) repeat protein
MSNELTAAVAMHQAGQWDKAARLYLMVLARQEQNADALHLFGVLHHQQGRPDQAVALITQALALRPNMAAYHANLAEAYRALGQRERAVGCCRAALRLWPDFPEAHCNLGLALQELGRKDEAAESFRRALHLRPEFPVAHNNLGIALRDLGRPDVALSHFRRAVELDPGYALARSNLGQLLVERGQAEEALPHCREAVRLQPDHAAMHHNLGNALRSLKRPVEARAAYLEALRLDPNLALAHSHLGLLLQGEGQLGEALTWLRQAVDLEPANPHFWEDLARLHEEREDLRLAIPCWECVPTFGPERAAPHLSLGWALQEEGRLAEAGWHYQEAVRLEPASASARLNLGGLHEEEGELAQAEADFRAALRLQPRYALPHARLATLLRGKLADSDRAALEERLADAQLGPGPRARLLFGLAHVLDARGDFDRAADCLRQANALTLELGRGHRDYFPAEHETFVDGLLRAFDRDWLTLHAGAGLDTRRPVFIFGLPRSGTTLVEQVLASHPQIYGAGELRLARQSFEAIPEVLSRADQPLDSVRHLDGAAIRQLGERHLDALQALDGGRFSRIIDKMPDNYMYVGLLAALFPRAVFIHCRRDLRDVAVSCWMTDFRSIRWANDPEHIASRFQEYRRLMDHWQAVLPGRIHHVDYEETVADLEGVARRLLAACGLEWHPACLEFYRSQRPVRTASVTQVRQPVYKQSVARWKNYERALAGMFAALPGENKSSETIEAA